ncbi:hypothetical protein GGS24DRAFT_465558 [Hypoxylon argillaceum]|nr:hypothetical protein GGS24DRAFT_465558 [Hypoxylon argillaceum]KAI1156744.1 hypothetical protein F4825DRAFT_402268 [Nemania diffusa]
MQGDIFQLESLVAVAKPQPVTAFSKPTSDTQVSIYNEDDLSHLLYASNKPYYHHRHHHHHHTHEPAPFTHPADAGMVLINTIMDDVESTTPALSDCESCYDSESSSGLDVEGPMTPPLSTFEDVADGGLDAYRRKGRRNAVSVAFEDGFEFPIFLGRQDAEEWQVVPESKPVATAAPTTKKATAVDVPATKHVASIGGPLMSWWPEPMETMEHNWDVENRKWELQLEREKITECERRGGIVSSEEKAYEPRYDGARPVANIEGPLMSWWPESVETMEHEWSERFYE